MLPLSAPLIRFTHKHILGSTFCMDLSTAKSSLNAFFYIKNFNSKLPVSLILFKNMTRLHVKFPIVQSTLNVMSGLPFLAGYSPLLASFRTPLRKLPSTASAFWRDILRASVKSTHEATTRKSNSLVFMITNWLLSTGSNTTIKSDTPSSKLLRGLSKRCYALSSDVSGLGLLDCSED